MYPWIVPALDLSRRDGVLGVAAGAESWLFHNRVGLRGGINRDEVGAGLSYYQVVGKRYGVEGIPHMVIIGKAGRIISVHRGCTDAGVDKAIDDLNRALAR